MMRIALVVPGGVDRSGEYRVIPGLLALIERLSRRADVQVLALHQEPLPGSWDIAGARVHNVGARHTRLRAVRLIRTLHRAAPFRLVHAMWSAASGQVAVTAACSLRLPSLVHVTGGEVVDMPEIGFGGRQSWRGRLREALVLRAASAVTATSTPVVELLARLGVRSQRLPLGVDLSSWPPRPPQPRPPERPARLIHVASLNRVKDQTTLLHALAALGRAGVAFLADIVGEDTLHGEIQALAEQLQLTDRVRFRGFLTQRELRPLVDAADLMLVSSRHEAGPLVMLEAAVAGVPTVGTAVGHLAEWAPQAAVAVPIGNPPALAQAIEQLLADEDRRLELARQAQQRAILQDADYTAERFLRVYAGLIA
ncbi:MAG TPA: glycosyltransferase family 4 protein [Steroidobacteraceae bacterium]|jgi:glycosyltransferase involved in cell wall biosynthesis